MTNPMKGVGRRYLELKEKAEDKKDGKDSLPGALISLLGFLW